jgi:hypothetical protein
MVSGELPSAAHANGGKCILRDVLEAGGNFAHIGVGGVGICDWCGRVILELLFDVPEIHIERKSSDIDIEKPFLPKLVAGWNKVNVQGETIPLRECPPISCLC